MLSCQRTACPILGEGGGGESGLRPKFFCEDYFCFHFATQPQKQGMRYGPKVCEQAKRPQLLAQQAKYVFVNNFFLM